MEAVENVKAEVKTCKLVCPKCRRVKMLSSTVIQLAQKYPTSSRCKCGHLVQIASEL